MRALHFFETSKTNYPVTRHQMPEWNTRSRHRGALRLKTQNISLTECNSGTTQKLSFVVNTTIELKNIAPISHNTGTLVNGYISRWMSLLSDVAIIFFTSIV